MSDQEPRIVNGITVRPREKVNVWLWVALLLTPDFVLMALGVVLATFGLRRYLAAKRSWPIARRQTAR